MYTIGSPWQFITSPPGWWAIYKGKDGKHIALPIVAWRMMPDNRDEDNIANSPDKQEPYGEPMIHGGDGMLESAFGQGNPIPGDKNGFRYDFRDGWMFSYSDYIPKIKGILRQPEGDVIYWEVL